MSLDTLANVKTRLGITTSSDDTLLGKLQASADLWITNYCNRDFGGGTYTEYHPGATEYVFLRNFPVQSVTSVHVDPAYGFTSATLLSPTAYTVHTDRGVIQSLTGPFLPTETNAGFDQEVHDWTRWPRVVKVVYVVATADVASDILEVYAQLVGHWYRRVKTQSAVSYQNVTQQKLGDAWVTYSTQQIAGLAYPSDVLQLLESYRVPSL